MKQQLEGCVDRIIYFNENNGYCVFAFSSTAGVITAAGVLPSIMKGSRYKIEGEFKNHPKYGMQFSFYSFSEIVPEDSMSIVLFLSSGVIKGIGPAAAKAIVDKFGKDTFRIIECEPDKLTTVSGIGKVKAEAIVEGYKAHRSYADTVMALSPYGVGAPLCMKLLKAYGPDAAQIVLADPYRLIDDFEGFGFAKADRIARSSGIQNDDSRRIRAGILAMMQYIVNDGNTFICETDAYERFAQQLEVSRDNISDAVFDLVMEGRLVKEKLNDRVIIMLSYLRDAEAHTAAALFALDRASLTHINADADTVINAASKNAGITLSPMQRQAVISSVKNGVSVITGGPGTGKTTIINMILAVLRASGMKSLLAAPTGRAAKRMSQAACESAQTIHRLLEASCSEDGYMYFAKNEENPLQCDCVIIDEMSMVDITLMASLLRAIRPGTRLILVGDADQLPSVGPGSVLRDIINSETIHCTKLTSIFRQASESNIIVNAHAVNNGEYPVCNEKDTDFFMMECTSQKEAAALIKDLCTTRLPAYFPDVDPMSGIQVLTPTKKDLLGTANLNKELQNALNPPSAGKPEMNVYDRLFRLGDKVIQIKNDYMLEWTDTQTMLTDRGVFNGDMGTVTAIDAQNGFVSVLYDDTHLVRYDLSNIDELDTAYALTVHKSQGSEFPVVVMPVFSFISVLTGRNLLYTAITRAKTAVVLVGRRDICNAMVDNNATSIRSSGLGYRLQSLRDFGSECNALTDE